MDVVFANSLGAPTVNYDPDDEYAAEIKARIDDAVDYDQSYLSLARQENLEYYNGLLPAIQTEDEDGNPVNRSSVVSTDVRDTVMTILPSLIRIFTSSENVVFYEPNSEEQSEMAAQSTDYANHVFLEDNDGVLVLHSAFKDALITFFGITRVKTDNDHEVTENTYENLDPEMLQRLVYERPDVEIVDLQTAEDGMVASVTLRYLISKPLHRVNPVPPEEFRVDRKAKDWRSARLIGQEEFVPVSDIVKKGFDREWVEQYVSSGSTVISEERYLRNPGLTEVRDIDDGVLWGEFFIRIDGDGDGVDELRRVCTIGDNHEIVYDDIVPDHDFAIWSVDPRPHTILSDTMADLTKDVQRIKTALIRGNLDNLAESINPKTVINELTTNIEDALNDEVGAVIRTRGDPNAAVAFSKVPYVGSEIQPSIDYMDKIRTSRTGISEASKGLDPKALQSTALTGIDAIISGAQERIELIARLLAQTGFKRLFKLLLREITNHPNRERTLKLRGKWTRVDPSTYDPDMAVKVNPTLGRGSDLSRLMALREIAAKQEMIMTKFGIRNPVVTPREYRNTIVDMLEIANIKNVSRYFREIDDDTFKAIMSAPEEPAPEQLLAQAEYEKNKKDVVIAIDKGRREDRKLELEQQRVQADDDFRRDKLNIDAALEAAKLLQDTGEQVSPQAQLLNMNRSGNSE